MVLDWQVRLPMLSCQRRRGGLRLEVLLEVGALVLLGRGGLLLEDVLEVKVSAPLCRVGLLVEVLLEVEALPLRGGCLLLEVLLEVEVPAPRFCFGFLCVVILEGSAPELHFVLGKESWHQFHWLGRLAPSTRLLTSKCRVCPCSAAAS